MTTPLRRVVNAPTGHWKRCQIQLQFFSVAIFPTFVFHGYFGALKHAKAGVDCRADEPESLGVEHEREPSVYDV